MKGWVADEGDGSEKGEEGRRREEVGWSEDRESNIIHFGRAKALIVQQMLQPHSHPIATT